MFQTNPIQTPVQYLKGVGPYFAKILGARRIYTIHDLLHCFPHRYLDRRDIYSIQDVEPGKNKAVIGKIIDIQYLFAGRRRKKILQISVEDETGILYAKWFNYYKDYMEKKFTLDKFVWLSGEVKEYQGHKEIIHPEIDIMDGDSFEDISQTEQGRIHSVYPLTEGLGQKKMRFLVQTAWDKYNSYIKNQLPNSILCRHHFIGSSLVELLSK